MKPQGKAVRRRRPLSERTRVSGLQQALTAEEVGERLQISVKTVLKMAAAGQLKGFRCGRLWRFPAVVIDDIALNGMPPTNRRC